MDRAIVLIGVQQTGGLPRLPAVGDAIVTLRDWASAQGIPAEKIAVVSDLDGTPVGAEAVFDAVDALAQSPTLQQLVIYFCGHGIVNNRNEFWLLSAAPKNPNAAVNVAKSAELAATGRIPHVVFISDACRTASKSVNAQGVTGSVITPNLGVLGPSRAVDIFYPCRLGDPAFEIEDPDEAGRYHALYTEALAAGLRGEYAEAWDLVADAGRRVGLVRPRLLADALPHRLADRAAALKAGTTFDQTPDARITSDSRTAWLARLEDPDPADADGGGTEPLAGDPVRPPRTPPRGSRRWPFGEAGDPAARAARAAADRLFAHRLAGGPESGLVLRGTRITEAWVEPGFIAENDDRTVRVRLPEGAPAVRVLLRLASGGCAVVPVLRGRSAIVTVEDGQLVDVWYTQRVEDRRSAPSVWRHRAGIAAASRYGLPLPDDPWPDVADDPALALYQAYSLVDTGQRGSIPDVEDDLVEAVGASFFDLQLLTPGGRAVAMPGFPLMGRGWALLDATGPGADVPRPLSSHWTLFHDTAFPLVQTALKRT